MIVNSESLRAVITFLGSSKVGYMRCRGSSYYTLVFYYFSAKYLKATQTDQ